MRKGEIGTAGDMRSCLHKVGKLCGNRHFRGMGQFPRCIQCTDHEESTAESGTSAIQLKSPSFLAALITADFSLSPCM